MSFELPTKDEKADYVLAQFDRIAAKYDLVNDLISFGMHRLWKARAINEMLGPLDGSYLDLCTGTGDLAFAIANSEGFSGRVIGLDFSKEMLKVAEQRSKKSGENNSSRLCFQQGDALALPFENDSFDGAIISFGLRNLSDLQKGLDEMARVVKSGGRVVNLDLGQPDLPLFTPLFLFFFDNIVPLIGEIVQNDRKAYTYLPESRKSYPHPQRLCEMFEQAGITNTRWIKLAFASVACHVGTVK